MKIEKPRKTEEKKIENTEHKPSSHSGNLIVVIRIDGEVKVKPKIKYTLDIMRLRRKYSCVLLRNHDNLMGMIKTVKNAVAFGDIEKETLVKLLKARAQRIDKTKFNAEEIAEELMKGKKLKDLRFKPFFRLHPPRGGIKSKLQYPKGVLGNNKKDINKLIERML